MFSSNADALAQHVRALSRFGNGIASTVRSYAMLSHHPDWLQSSLNHSQLHNVKMRKTNRWHLLVIWSHKHWHRERCCRHSSAAAHVAVRCVLLQPVSLLLEHAGGVYAISKVSSGAIFSCSNDFTVRQVRSHRMRAKPQPSQAKPQHAVRTYRTNSMQPQVRSRFGQHHSAAHPKCAAIVTIAESTLSILRTVGPLIGPQGAFLIGSRHWPRWAAAVGCSVAPARPAVLGACEPRALPGGMGHANSRLRQRRHDDQSVERYQRTAEPRLCCTQVRLQHQRYNVQHRIPAALRTT